MKNAPMFERRHYEAIAELIREHVGLGDMERLRLAEDFADRLARDNPRFDRSRFLKASGAES